MPEYNESTLAGSSWQRACKVVIDNPIGSTSNLSITEEKVYQLGYSVIRESLGAGLSVTFDSNNPKHVELYNLLNDLYIEQRAIRDAI
jgi:hypothetical protein